MTLYYILSKFKNRIFRTSSFENIIKKCRIGSNTYGLDYECVNSYRNDDSLTIGSYCSIARDVFFILSGEHFTHRVSTFPLKDFGEARLGSEEYIDTKTKGPVIVGNDVWIGARATILSGVRIGNGAVIGAGSIVVNDVPPYAIVAGVPAKILRYRFNNNQINQLEKIKWWDWGEELINSRLLDFYVGIDDFIEKYKNE